jgi:exosortase A-associated hydrolase 1
MTFTEHCVTFPCAGEQLLGIVAAPERPQKTGVLIVVGGPQYRVGSHRQFLLISRALAEAGYPTMRFDFRGMGDSTGELRDFEGVNEDVGAAIDEFQAHCPQLERIVLWGLCDAATAGLLYWDLTRDARIGGQVLLNPWVRSEATLARTHIKHYYGQRLFQAEFWHKLLRGKLGIKLALQGLATSWLRARKTSGDASAEATVPFQKRMMRALEEFSGPTLLILSSDDYTAKEFLEACQADAQATLALAGAHLTRVDVPGADHTFSSCDLRQAVEAATLAWLKQSAAP